MKRARPDPKTIQDHSRSGPSFPRSQARRRKRIPHRPDGANEVAQKKPPRRIQEEFDAALGALIERVKRDRSILAAIIRGSMAEEKVWAKSDIDLALVTVDDGKSPRAELSLDADGINVHVWLVSRAEFRRTAEGAACNSFSHAALAKGRLLYTHDESIRDLLAKVVAIGEGDTQRQLLVAGYQAAYVIYKAHKCFLLRGDLEYTAFTILEAANLLAKIEVLGAGLLVDRDVMPKALKINPAFFKTVFVDLLNTRKTAKAVRGALDAIDRYLAERTETLFGPVLNFLQEVGEARSATEIEDGFFRKFGIPGATCACEYLADQGLIGRAALPVRLTRRSSVEMEEIAYFYTSAPLQASGAPGALEQSDAI